MSVVDWNVSGLDTDIGKKCNHNKLLHWGSAHNTAIQGWGCQRMLCLCEYTVYLAVVLVNGENSLPLCVRTEFIIPAWASHVAAPCTWGIVGAIWGKDRCMLGCFSSTHCACTAVWLTQCTRGRNVCVCAWGNRRELNKIDFGWHCFSGLAKDVG